MKGGSRTDGGIRWHRRNLKPWLLSAMLPLPTEILGIINRTKHKCSVNVNNLNFPRWNFCAPIRLAAVE